MDRAFVTGGSGFVGRELIRELRRRNIAVAALARSDGASNVVESCGARVVREEFFRINVAGTENALAAAKSAGVHRFIHIGTEAVLADGDPIVRADETRPRAAHPAGGHYLTSTCHVRNVVEGALLAAEKGKPGEIYFLTDGAPVEFREFITKLLATQNVDPGARSIPKWMLEK